MSHATVCLRLPQGVVRFSQRLLLQGWSGGWSALTASLIGAGLLVGDWFGGGVWERVANAAPDGPVAARDDAFSRPKSWTVPTEAELRDAIDTLIQARRTEGVRLTAEQVAQIEEALTADDANVPGNRLERVVRALAVIEPDVAELIDAVDDGQVLKVLTASWVAPPGSAPEPPRPPADGEAPDQAPAERDTPEGVPGERADVDQGQLPRSPADRFVRDHARLYLARELVRLSLFDQALDQIHDLDPKAVADPATLLFFRATCHHRMIRKRDCLDTIATLLERETELPVRYVAVAKLMRADMEPLKADTLDEVARIMRNVEDRLDSGQAGKRVRQEEDDIVKKLDKMIEDLEQQQQAAAAAAAASNNLSPSQPMQDSVPGGGSGPGDVDPKRMAGSGNWGNLPPKQREEALQDLSKDLPAHYREVIEEYFRRLAQDER